MCLNKLSHHNKCLFVYDSVTSQNGHCYCEGEILKFILLKMIIYVYEHVS